MMKKIFNLCVCLFIGVLSCTSSNKSMDSIAKSKEVIDFVAEGFFKNVNIIFILDNSGSMSEEIKLFEKNISYFLEIIPSLSNLNYNIAVFPAIKTTPDPAINANAFNMQLFQYNKNNTPPLSPPQRSSRSKNPKPVQSEIPKILCDQSEHFFVHSDYRSFLTIKSEHIKERKNYEDFLCLVNKQVSWEMSIETTNSGDEYYFSPLERIFQTYQKSDSFFQTFFSKESFLVVVFISDATGVSLLNLLSKEEGVTSNIEALVESNVNVVINQLHKLKGNKFFKGYGVIPTSLNDCHDYEEKTPLYESGDKLPLHVHDFIQKTGGKMFPLCDSNWGRNLQIMSEDLKSSLVQKTFALKHIPLLDFLKVFYNGHSIPNDIQTGWYYDPETFSVVLGDDFNVLEYYNNAEEAQNHLTIEYIPFNERVLLKEIED